MFAILSEITQYIKNEKTGPTQEEKKPQSIEINLKKTQILSFTGMVINKENSYNK